MSQLSCSVAASSSATPPTRRRRRRPEGGTAAAERGCASTVRTQIRADRATSPTVSTLRDVHQDATTASGDPPTSGTLLVVDSAFRESVFITVLEKHPRLLTFLRIVLGNRSCESFLKVGPDLEIRS